MEDHGGHLKYRELAAGQADKMKEAFASDNFGTELAELCEKHGISEVVLLAKTSKGRTKGFSFVRESVPEMLRGVAELKRYLSSLLD